jgi:hypothetical protein
MIYSNQTEKARNLIQEFLSSLPHRDIQVSIILVNTYFKPEIMLTQAFPYLYNFSQL